MIRLLFIVPYPELKETVDFVLQNHRFQEEVQADVRVRIVQEALSIDPSGFDAIIARGYTAELMGKRWPDKPLINLQINGFDVVRAVGECLRLYHPRRIAAVVSGRQFFEAEDVAEPMQLDLRIYEALHHEELPAVVRQAAADGCEAIVGGYSSSLEARAVGLPAVVIRTGSTAVLRAVEEAVNTVLRIRREHITSQTYKTIIYSYRDGILYVDREGVIRVRNRAMQQMHAGKRLMDQPLEAALPYLYPLFRSAMETREESTGHLLTIPGTDRRVSAACRPVVADQTMAGVVLVISDITEIQRLESQIRRKLNERGLKAKYSFSDIAHESAAMNKTIETARSYAQSEANVIIVGETGTGKELFAQSIHQASRRSSGPFVVINCAALPDNLLESELFGYSEGAFTGAMRGGKQGLFEQAHGGTLMLDEIEEMPLSTQTKLLRVLQERQVRRIGDNKMIAVDVRIISATNKSIEALCSSGKFRRDLMYRLDVLRLFVPPLRSRGQDVEMLFLQGIRQRCAQSGQEVPPVDPNALELLHSYTFSGNIRELNNVVERLCALSPRRIGREQLREALYPEDLSPEAQPWERPPEPAPGPEGGAVPQPEQEAARIRAVLEQCGYRRDEAAALLGMHRTTLWRKMKQYGL